MSKINIGLDFGTFQSKACIFDSGDNIHEFVYFERTGSYFCPTMIAETTDGRFVYGSFGKSDTTRTYHYFKIAAAEDEEFRAESSTDSNVINTEIYKRENFAPYTPEFLSVAYIAHLILLIKSIYQNKQAVPVIAGSLLADANSSGDEGEAFDRSIKMGIPTEWSQVKNLRRKRKFESILYLADKLQEKYGNLERYESQKIEQIRNDVIQIYTESKSLSQTEFEDILNVAGLSVYPETAAGLSFILETRQIPPGNYAIMDIGAGSTDISYFRLTDTNEIRYYTSESYIVAANSVEHEKVKIGLKAAVAHVGSELEKLFRKLFMKRVYFIASGQMVKKFRDQPLIVYGGGTQIDHILKTHFVFYNYGGGQYSERTSPETMEVKNVGEYQSKINILPLDKTWEQDIALLVVALGLSFVKPLDSAAWYNIEEYKSSDNDKPLLVPHPVNEDCYIYDVFI